MDIQELLDREILSFGSLTVDMGQLLQIVGVVGLLFLAGYLILYRWLPRFYAREDTSAELRPQARRVIFWSILSLTVIAVLQTLDIDYLLWPDNEAAIENVHIRISNLVKAFLLLSMANLLDWMIKEALNQWSFRQENSDESSQRNLRLVSRFQAVRPVVYTFILNIISNDMGFAQLGFRLGQEEDATTITVGSILAGLLIFFVIRLIWQIIREVTLNRYYARSKVDEGSREALNQLLTYFAYIIGFLLMLQTAGFSLVALWTGAAALLVGIGIGLQQTFNDLICGVIILFERTVKVGDMVDMGGPEKVGRVRKIGARTSHVETRDGILMYVPNSKLIGESVVNWSQTERRARFHISVGVAYGSDTELVKKLLLEVATAHPQVMKLPKPLVRFMDFGSSSLDFELLIFTRNFMLVEDTKSDLRFAIDAAFRKNGVEIPFPQRDLWVRGGTGLDVFKSPTDAKDNVPDK